jgi:GTP cyclohydrolase II
MRFQQLMPDVLHWLGVSRIDRFVSMSDLKFGPLVESGIKVLKRVEIPEGLIPADARVEMDAKKAAGYFTEKPPSIGDLIAPKGRGLTE